MVRAGIAEDSLIQPLKNSRTLALIGQVEGVEATLSYFSLNLIILFCGEIIRLFYGE